MLTSFFPCESQTTKSLISTGAAVCLCLCIISCLSPICTWQTHAERRGKRCLVAIERSQVWRRRQTGENWLRSSILRWCSCARLALNFRVCSTLEDGKCRRLQVMVVAAAAVATNNDCCCLNVMNVASMVAMNRSDRLRSV